MEAQMATVEEARRRRALDSSDLVRMRIGQRYWSAKLSEIPEGLPYRKALLTYAEGAVSMRQAGTGLLLWGDNGTGKTSAACAVLKEARRQMLTGLFLTSIELRELFYKDQEFEPGTSMLRRAQAVDFLVIDDMGKEVQQGDHAARILEDVVRRRSNELRPTILTSNMKPAELAKVYHASFMELLTGCVVILHIGGANWRLGESVVMRRALGI